MKVTKQQNGQITVEHENLQLIHTQIDNLRFNSCMINRGEYWEDVSESKPEFQPLFIALVNYKNQSHEKA